MRTLRIGTRASKLALRQTTIVADAIRRAHPGISLEMHEIKTEGDLTNAPLKPFLHAGIKRPTHDDPPSIWGSTLEGIAVQASRGETESLDHLLRRFANQIAEAIKLLRLVGRVNSGSTRR